MITGTRSRIQREQTSALGNLFMSVAAFSDEIKSLVRTREMAQEI